MIYFESCLIVSFYCKVSDSKDKYSQDDLQKYYTNGKHFILGIVFLDSYYSIWDDDNSQIALVPNLKTSAKIL